MSRVSTGRNAPDGNSDGHIAAGIRRRWAASSAWLDGVDYFRGLASASGSGSAVVDFTRSMLIRLLTFFGATAAISRL